MKSIISRLVWLLAAQATLCLAHDLPPRLDLTTSGGALKLKVEGEVGSRYRLESNSAGFGLGQWDPLLTLTLTNAVQWWEGPMTAPFQFFRVQRMDGTLQGSVANFRLLDQQGKSRELYYYWNEPTTKAVVLIFTANGCQAVRDSVVTIKSLRDQFQPRGVLFWMVDSSPLDTRASIAAESNALGLDLPILYDPAQNVARAYQASTAPEVVCINPADWASFYRGAIASQDDPTKDPVPRPYLANALNQFLAGTEIGDKLTDPNGCKIGVTTLPAISYTKQIAPLLQAKCVSCHSPGNIAPWSMTNYATVKLYAPAISAKTMDGSMPPWHADPLYGKFSNDVSLTREESSMLLHWIDDGAPRGDGPDPLETAATPPPAWPVELGEPDAIIKIDPQIVKASGIEPYRYIFAKTDYPEDRWLKAAVIRPGNRKVVHHYLVWLGTDAFDKPTGIATYVPGQTPTAYPAGTGTLLPAGTWLTFNLHYTPTGDEEVDQPELGLYFLPKPPESEFRTQPIFPVKGLSAYLNIPPGVKEHEVSVSYTFSRSVKVYSLSPHMHYRGTRMNFLATYPDGTQEMLLSVPNYVFHWQTSYQLAEPKILPPRTKITVTGAFDNSAQNLLNPDPTQRISWGEQSMDEMFIGYVNFSVVEQ